MSHCFDCNSSYDQPGTCNCFAPGGKRAVRLSVAAGATELRSTDSPPYTVVVNVSANASDSNAMHDLVQELVKSAGARARRVADDAGGA